MKDLQFELSTGSIYADQACMEQVEAGNAPRNLVQLAGLGRLTVWSATEEAGANPGTVALPDMLEGAQDGHIAEADYDRLDVGDWTRDDYIEYGQWLDGLVRDPGQTRSRLTVNVLNRGRDLGIGPGPGRIQRDDHFSTLSAYYRALPIVPSREMYRYDELTEEGLADYAEGVFVDLLNQRNGHTRRPRLSQEIARRARLGEGPGLQAFEMNGGSLREIMLSRGYYIDVRHLEPEDYVELGVKIRQANDGRQVTMKAIDFLAQTRRAPTSRSFQNKFRWDDYLGQVQIAYESPDPSGFREKLPVIKQELKDGALPLTLIEDAQEPEEVLARRAKWLLAGELLPGLNARQRQFIVKNIRTAFEGVVRVRGNVSDADIQEAAVRLGVAEDLWPSRREPEPYMDYLKAPEELMGPA